MGYSEYNLTEYGETPRFDRELLTQLERLGFDPKNEIPSTFAYFEIYEGLDRYAEIRQSLLTPIDATSNNLHAQFIFRGLQDENSSGFILAGISVQLLKKNGDSWDKLIENSYSGSPDYPTKTQMINKARSQAEQIEKIVNRLVGIPPDRSHRNGLK